MSLEDCFSVIAKQILKECLLMHEIDFSVMLIFKKSAERCGQRYTIAEANRDGNEWMIFYLTSEEVM